jgi:hypothetical protein
MFQKIYINVFHTYIFAADLYASINKYVKNSLFLKNRMQIKRKIFMIPNFVFFNKKFLKI